MKRILAYIILSVFFVLFSPILVPAVLIIWAVKELGLD